MPNKYLQQVKEKALRTIANARGWRTSRHIVVFESDDWGATRMRDRNALQELRRQRLQLDDNRYHVLDCLENRGDLERLFEVLDAHRDQRGSPPTFTFNTVLGNPDFDAIRANRYEQYSRENLWSSYRRYHGEDLQELWMQGLQASLIRPQFHGREHLNVRLWMDDLRGGLEETRKAFDQEYYGLTTRTSSQRQHHYLAAYWPVSQDHVQEIRGILVEGLNEFEEYFGFRSKTFVACNYVLPRGLDATTVENGIRLIQGQRGQRRPDDDGAVSIMRTYTGMRNEVNQIYSVRNVMFEPYIDESRDWVSSAIQEIEESFAWGKPAVVCTHRINYVSGMSQRHREQTLFLLNELLQKILRRWPDVEFVSSDRLLTIIEQ